MPWHCTRCNLYSFLGVILSPISQSCTILFLSIGYNVFCYVSVPTHRRLDQSNIITTRVVHLVVGAPVLCPYPSPPQKSTAELNTTLTIFTEIAFGLITLFVKCIITAIPAHLLMTVN